MSRATAHCRATLTGCWAEKWFHQFPARKIPESRVRPRRTGLVPNELSSLSSSTLFLALYASATKNAFHFLQITLFILPQGLCTCYSLCLECFSFPFLA